MDALELVNKIKNKKNIDEEWLEIRNEVIQFLNGEHPEEEKKLFSPFGYMEKVTMMCDALVNKKD